MKSFCIKSNNNIILDYLLTEFKRIDNDNLYVSKKKFKYYKNVIVHYTGETNSLFIYKISEVLTNCILKFYEQNIVRRIINCDFFYFEQKEKKMIYNNCLEILSDEDSNEFDKRREIIFYSLTDYIAENKFFILDGFVNFRLFEYNSILEECVDVAVNKFIIDKEYREFIELLKGYINSQKNRADTIHVIYSSAEPILLDENQNVLVYDNQFEQPKYLSDISFSSKDYCLNALLNLIPKKIIIHLLVEEDEFIETLKLIFGKRLMICKECNICKTFSLLNVH